MVCKAQPGIIIHPDERLFIGQHISYFVDSAGTLPATEISGKNFRRSHDQILNLGLNPYVVWMKFQVTAIEDDDYYLEIMTPLFEHLDIYRVEESRLQPFFRSGFDQSFNKRPVQTENLLLPLKLKPGITTTFYIRASTGFNFQIPMAISSKGQLVESGETHYLFWGIYIGVMIFALVYNFFIYLSVRERRYLFYILYVIGSTAFYLSIQGFAFQFFWPSTPSLNQNSVVLICFTNIIIAFFTVDFLQITKKERGLYYSAQAIVVVFFLIAMVNIFGPYAKSVAPAQGLSLVICLFCIYAGFDSLKRGIRSARYFLTAWTLFAILTMTFVLTINNVITSTFFTTHCIFIGHMTEVLLLSFALADRINSLKKENEHFQKELMNAQQEIQEQTFQEVSQEIHDNICQVLTLVKLNLNQITSQSTESARHQLTDSKILLSKAIQDLRDLSRSLNTEFINDIGLEEALRQQLGMLEKTGVFETRLSTENEAYRLPLNHELVVFRMVQELLNNIVKHADATTIDITMDYLPHNILIQIRDNGKGFDDTSLKGSSGKGIGLHNIRNRVKLLKGSLRINSKNGEGASIAISLPR